ncbi:hypothetical protein A7X67_04245 [Clostridium sp. W14A]|nr:hypothetical protein A7X67_04245 [Clostridium sp. W14A]
MKNPSKPVSLEEDDFAYLAIKTLPPNSRFEKYWHFDNIDAMSEADFTSDYLKWAKEKGYRPSKAKAAAIYALAKDGIPTLLSNTPSTKILILCVQRGLGDRSNKQFLRRPVREMKQKARCVPPCPACQYR